MNSSKHIAVCLEHRFYQVNGKVYTKLAFPYYYWKDYLTFFNKVTVIARVKNMDKVEKGMVLVSGKGVDVYPLPYYLGIKEFIHTLPALVSSLSKASTKYDRFLLRSGNSTNILFFLLLKSHKPYIREYPGNVKQGVIGFAGDSFQMRILATFLDKLAKVQARYSKANSFVSEYCRELYSSDKPSFVFSSFKSSEVSARKTSYDISSVINVVSVGRLEGEKGHINLLRAVKNIPNIKVHLIGDGNQKVALQNYASKHNIKVKFYGTITDREKLFSILESSDLFIIPSLTEGMPRALLEAMTIGLPCLGSNVGGIPEVLQSNDLYDANDLQELYKKISLIINDQLQRESTGQRNQKFIENNFSDQALTDKKHKFWSKLYE